MNPTPSSSKRPNVILIVSDEHRADSCGCYGSPVRQTDGRSPTPALDALAAGGIRFDAMYCASPLSAPSRAAYMTGMYPHTTTALHHKMQRREAGLTRFPGVRDGIPGMGQYFRDAGYRTAAIGKMHVHGECVDGWDLGFDERELRFYTQFPGKHYADLKDGDLNRRYREIPPYPKMTYREIDPVRFARAPEGLRVGQNGENQHYLETLIERGDEMYDMLVTDRSLDFIDRQTREQTPFFIHVGLEKPHRPWTVPQSYLDRFNPDDMPLPETIAEWREKGHFPFAQTWCHTETVDDEARRAIAAYYACVAEVDDCVERIVAKCEALGILDNTIIVYTSDHGESLFDCGLIEKHNMLEPSAQVPFILHAPRCLPKGAVVKSPASLLDILPTLCDMAGIQGSDAFEGESLMETVAGKQDPGRLVFSEFYEAGSGTRPGEFLPIRMGLNAACKYVYTHAAADQLYARDQDGPEPERNLAFDPAHEPLVSRMRLCTLADWELDEYPQLSARAEVTSGGVHLRWEAAAPDARYDVYRSARPDPRSARRIAAGIPDLRYTDATADTPEVYYWVLGHYALTQPFTDPLGKRRYGDLPLTMDTYPRSLPVTPCMRVKVRDGWRAAFEYTPLLSCTLFDLPWLHIGHPPKITANTAEISGPVTLLTPRPQTGPYMFSAELKTQSPGKNPEDTLKLIVNYQNMHNFYLIGFNRDGTLGVWRQRGENDQEELACKHIVGADVTKPHLLTVTAKADTLHVALNGESVFDVTDPDPLPPGRAGFEAPLHLRAADIRMIRLESLAEPHTN